MAEVVSTGVSHMCDNSTISVKTIIQADLISKARFQLK